MCKVFSQLLSLDEAPNTDKNDSNIKNLNTEKLGLFSLSLQINFTVNCRYLSICAFTYQKHLFASAFASENV